MKIEVFRKYASHKTETLAILDLEGSQIPRVGDYMSVMSPVDEEGKTLSGFGTYVRHVGWHYKGSKMEHIIIEVE